MRDIYTLIEDRYETIPVDMKKYKESVWKSYLINRMIEDRNDYGIEQD